MSKESHRHEVANQRDLSALLRSSAVETLNESDKLLTQI